MGNGTINLTKFNSYLNESLVMISALKYLILVTILSHLFLAPHCNMSKCVNKMNTEFVDTHFASSFHYFYLCSTTGVPVPPMIGRMFPAYPRPPPPFGVPPGAMGPFPGPHGPPPYMSPMRPPPMPPRSMPPMTNSSSMDSPRPPFAAPHLSQTPVSTDQVVFFMLHTLIAVHKGVFRILSNI